jgi:uncharacterized protein YfaS (alpha-2-macroglobulin family)
MYDKILLPEKPSLPFLAAGGGDEFREGFFSPYQRQQELLSLFIPTVWVGATGEAEVELKIPEYSGQARLTVVAGSLERFGIAGSSVRINRDLTVETTIPLALAPGDTFIATSRIVKDPEAQADTQVEIDFSTTGPLSIIEAQDEQGPFDPKAYRPAIEPGAGRTVKLKVSAVPETQQDRAENQDSAESGADIEQENSLEQVNNLDKSGPASLQSTVKFGSENFVSQATTVVRPPFPKVSISSGGQLKDKSTSLDLNSEGFLAGTVSAAFMLAPGPAAEVARAIEYLRYYPYGCLEQTVSGAWVHLAAQDLGDYISDDDPYASDLALSAAIKRLATMQTFQGSFVSWPGGSEVYQWGSVYAAHFLLEASKRTELPKGLLEDSLKFLKNELNKGLGSGKLTSADLAVKAYALYVLALNGEYFNGWINSLKERTGGLNLSSKIFLAASEALRSGRPEALFELEKDIKEADSNLKDSVSFESSSRNLSLRLLAFSQVDPLNPYTENLAGQAAASGRLGLWTNTQQNGMAVLALGTYLKKTGISEPFEAEVRAGDGTLLGKGSHLDPVGLGAKSLKGFMGKSINVTISGVGKPWYSLTVSGVPTEPPKVESNILELTRIWSLEGQDPINLTHPDKLPETLVFSKGQKVNVELAISASEHTENVVIADLIPGGFEIIGISGGSPEDGDYGNSYDTWRNTPRLELREDRVIAIIKDLYQTQTVSYSLRAVTEGQFVLPPTTAEGMYDPERKAVLPTTAVTIIP